MASQETPTRPSAAKRYLVVLVVGLLAGAICSVMALRALQARQDPFPSALMHVMAKQSSELRAAAAANRCTASDALPRLQALRAMANDAETAFPGLREDARFTAAASGLRATLDSALASPPTDCTQLTAVTKQIGENCQACHNDFK
jgi:cytochrome c556